MPGRTPVLILVPHAEREVTAKWRQNQAALIADAALRDNFAPIILPAIERAKIEAVYDAADAIGRLVGRAGASQAWVVLREDDSLGNGPALGAYRGWRAARGLAALPPSHGQPGVRLGRWEEWESCFQRLGLVHAWELLKEPVMVGKSGERLVAQ